MSLQTNIASFVKELREQKGLTQSDFAELLETSQSAVARMEKGEQNFSTEMLTKISHALNRKFLTIKNSVDFKIEGGHQLSGTIQTNTSKNGAMGLLCASLLNKGKTTLHGIPRIEEVNRILEVLGSIGVQTKWVAQNTLEMIPPKALDLASINAVSARKTRTILMFIGPLIHLFKNFSIPNSQGCKLGKRSISAHLYALENMGVKIKTTNTTYDIKVGDLKASEIVMYEA